MKKIIKSFIYLFLPIILGSLVGILINSNIDYNMLNKPPLAPPKVVFPIMWTIIYLLMGVSYYLYKKDSIYRTNSVRNSYYIQLVLNLLWSIIFFIFKLRFISIIWILVLSIVVFNLFTLYYKYKRLSAYLLIPYIIWLIFATYLTIGIYILN